MIILAHSTIQKSNSSMKNVKLKPTILCFFLKDRFYVTNFHKYHFENLDGVIKWSLIIITYINTDMSL